MAGRADGQRKPKKAKRVEHSAGFIIFTEAEGRRRYLLLDYGRHWDFPKGHIEPGEQDLQAARRELAEETSILAIEVVPGFNQSIDYTFRGRDGVAIDKTVVFFLAKVRAPQVVLSHEHVGYAFDEYPKAIARLTYANARHVLEVAETALNASAQRSA